MQAAVQAALLTALPDHPRASRERARHAWDTAQAALAAGDVQAAERWLDRARRLAPQNPAVALARATLLLRSDAWSGRAAFEALSLLHDRREIWLGLAAANRLLGDSPGAARALGRALEGHTAAADPALFAAATEMARDAAAPGWCALLSNFSLSWATVGDRDVAMTLHASEPGPALWARVISRGGDSIQIIRLPAAARGARALGVTCDGRHLIGSPILLEAIRRVEGCVTADASGLSGWAWHPADAGTPARLLVRAADGAATLQVLANGAEPNLPDDSALLARRRGFAVPAAALARLVPPFAVTSRDGVPLLGSPKDPGFELRGAEAAARTVLHSFPADRHAAQADAMGPGPGRPVTVRAAARGVEVIIAVASAAEAEFARRLLPTLENVDRLLVVAAAGGPMLAVLDAAPSDRRLHVVQVPHLVGFAAAVELGMREASPGRDLILLDRPAHFAPGWTAALARAARSAPAIGVAAPAASSSPHARPRRAEATEAVIDAPMLGPACLLLRRACLDSVGGLRPALFSQAPPAVTDFCLRARDLGWRLVVAAGVTAAWSDDRQHDAGARAVAVSEERLLSRLYPGRLGGMAAMAPAGVLVAERRLRLTRWRRPAAPPAVVLVTHDRGGGVERQVRRRARSLRRDGVRPIMLRPAQVPRSEESWVSADDLDRSPVLQFAVPREGAALAKLLRALDPGHVEFHHMLGHHFGLLALPRQLGVPYDVHVHDYACFCPRIALVSTERRHCSEPGAARCEACVADLGRVIEEDIPVAALRRRSSGLLADARRVVVPSADVAARLARHFPGLRSQISPWEDDAAIARPAVQPPQAGAPRRVAVIGAIGIEKGYEVLLACARDAASRDLNLSFTVVGHTIDDMRLIDTGRVFVTGEYAEDEAIDLIKSQHCDLAFLPAVWPETWSFTLSEAWRAGLRVAAFDLGTPAERIRRSGYGWLLSLGAPPHTVNNALLALA